MKTNIIILLLFISFTTALYAVTPVVSNVKASQRQDTSIVDIYFDVSDKDSRIIRVSFKASSNNGKTWDIPIIHTAGDTGISQTGKNKHVTWFAGKDYRKQFSSSFRIKVYARDKICPNIGDNGMAYIPAGKYFVNNEEISIPEFCIDKWEFPNVTGAYPDVWVSYQGAKDSCLSVGKFLCTESQWEISCAGSWRSLYPYSMIYSNKKCNTDGIEINDIGKNVACVSQYGVYDLSGNVYEWVDTWYSADGKEGNAKNSTYRSMRGGNYYTGAKFSKCNARQFEAPEYTNEYMGFRCCYSFKR